MFASRTGKPTSPAECALYLVLCLAWASGLAQAYQLSALSADIESHGLNVSFPRGYMFNLQDEETGNALCSQFENGREYLVPCGAITTDYYFDSLMNFRTLPTDIPGSTLGASTRSRRAPSNSNTGSTPIDRPGFKPEYREPLYLTGAVGQRLLRENNLINAGIAINEVDCGARYCLMFTMRRTGVPVYLDSQGLLQQGFRRYYLVYSDREVHPAPLPSGRLCHIEDQGNATLTMSNENDVYSELVLKEQALSSIDIEDGRITFLDHDSHLYLSTDHHTLRFGKQKNVEVVMLEGARNKQNYFYLRDTATGLTFDTSGRFSSRRPSILFAHCSDD